jgi:pectin methylesterase-like acyl-CoA thioesterase
MPVASAATIEVCATGGGQHSTIQAAVTAASAGDTINVCAGTYTENVSIDKRLTILGPNNSVAPGTAATRVSEAVVSGAVTIGSRINGVTLRGFKITSPSPANEVGVSIGSNSRNVSITYNDISGFSRGILS